MKVEIHGYILERKYNRMPSAAIKVPKAFVDSSVTKTRENVGYCRADGKRY